MSSIEDSNTAELISAARSLFEMSFCTTESSGKSSSSNCAVVFAPGRVNLIGEHTDYNGGFVMPLALTKKTVVVGRGSISVQNGSSNASVCRIVSSCAPNIETFKADDSLAPGDVEWTNYVKGVVAAYMKDVPPGHCLSFDAAIASDVPLGGGLSSSAALEVSVATLIEEITGVKVGGVEKALRCQWSDHNFLNTPCGIMDQFVSALAQRNATLLVDCRSNAFEPVPLDDPDMVFVVANSGIRHRNADGAYAERVRQCDEAVEAIKNRHPSVKQLRDALLEWVKQIEVEVDDKVFRRAIHVVTENQRTLCCAMALRRKDYVAAGSCMCDSHASLRDNYEVTIPELDCLVSIAMKVEGVFGSRMTGGGFGGCTVTLVKRDAAESLMETLRKEYLQQTGKECDCFVTQPCDGAGIIVPLRRSKRSHRACKVAAAAVGTMALLAALALFAKKRVRE